MEILDLNRGVLVKEWDKLMDNIIEKQNERKRQIESTKRIAEILLADNPEKENILKNCEQIGWDNPGKINAYLVSLPFVGDFEFVSSIETKVE